MLNAWMHYWNVLWFYEDTANPDVQWVVDHFGTLIQFGIIIVPPTIVLIAYYAVIDRWYRSYSKC